MPALALKTCQRQALNALVAVVPAERREPLAREHDCPVIGKLKAEGEEVDCAKPIDTHPAVKARAL